MAVYKRSYRPYEGAYTPRWSRFLILTRYAARGVFRSKIITGLFIISFFYPLLMAAGMYLNHNTRVLALAKVGSDHLMDINGMFFLVLMSVQASLAFLLTAFVGPNLIAPDLANNALPLYFCRPLSRTEYVFGRASVMLFLLSFITWVPGMALFGIETGLSGPSWAWEHRDFAFGILIGSWLWISILTLMALALSAWVRWKLVAGALLLGMQFATSAFAAAVNEILRTKYGFYMDPASLVATVWSGYFGVHDNPEIPVWGACIALAIMCSFFVFLLSRKVRAFEVVR